MWNWFISWKIYVLSTQMNFWSVSVLICKFLSIWKEMPILGLCTPKLWEKGGNCVWLSVAKKIGVQPICLRSFLNWAWNELTNKCYFCAVTACLNRLEAFMLQWWPMGKSMVDSHLKRNFQLRRKKFSRWSNSIHYCCWRLVMTYLETRSWKYPF